MKIREAGHEVGPVYVPFVASRHSRSLKAQKFIRLSKMRQDKEEPHPSEVACGALVQCIGKMKFACVHCPHFGLRTGSNSPRIGPDSACLQGSPVFARAGTRFESHLGHVFSLLRGLRAAECVQISFMAPCRGPFLLVAVAVAGRLLPLAWTAVLLCTPSWPGSLRTA